MNKKALWQIISEFISVVFAVLLALGLNSYKQNVDAEAEAERIKDSIIKEVELNLSRVDSTLYKNQDYANYLDSLVRMDPDDGNGFYFAYDFELLTSSAWQLSQNNSVTNSLNEDLLIEAAAIYQTQSFYQNFSEKMFQSIGQLLAQQDQLKESDMILSMYYNIGVMNSVAEDLKSKQENFLSKHMQSSASAD